MKETINSLVAYMDKLKTLLLLFRFAELLVKSVWQNCFFFFPPPPQLSAEVLLSKAYNLQLLRRCCFEVDRVKDGFLVWVQVIVRMWSGALKKKKYLKKRGFSLFSENSLRGFKKDVLKIATWPRVWPSPFFHPHSFRGSPWPCPIGPPCRTNSRLHAVR